MDALILDMGDDVRGESSLPGYTGKVELLSFSHGVSMQITGDLGTSKRTSGKPNHQDMTVTKHLDAASPVLNEACCTGKSFPKAEIIIGRNEDGGITEIMRYTMSNVIISSISVGGGGGDKPVETVTLNYTHITWKFTAQSPEVGKDGVVKKTWDLAKNAVE